MTQSKRLAPVALLAVAALAALPLFLHPGFLNTRGGGDSPFLLFRLHQLHSALSQGVFPVRWMPDAAYGLGYPFFSYYAALPLYLAAFLKFIGFPYVLALKLTHLAGFLLAAAGMYGWMRSLAGTRLVAWVAAAAYTFAPFHLVNVYVRGDSLNEFWAFAFYPLCLWGAQRIRNIQHQAAHDPSPAQKSQFSIAFSRLLKAGYLALPLALAYAALTFTHNISALIFSPFLALYVVVISLLRQSPSAGPEPPDSGQQRRSLTFVGLCALALALGLALSAFFWLPALREADFGQLAPVTQGYFYYGNHFRGRDLVQPALVFNFDVADSAGTPFAMGLAQAGLLGLAVGLSLLRLLTSFGNTHSRAQNTFIIYSGLFLVSFLVATFMITRYSAALWANLPLLPFVQFPWRFLSVQSLFASALIAFSLQPLAAHPEAPPATGQSSSEPEPAGPHRFWRGLSGSAILITPLCLVVCGLNIAGLRPDFIPLSDSDVTAERLQLYEYFTGNIGTTINYEYLPRWVQPRPYASAELIFDTASLKVLSGEAFGERLLKQAASQSWLVTVQSDSATLAIPLLYWPGWQAHIDGQALPLRPAEYGLGWVTFDLPHGEHRLDFSLGHTPLRQNASLLSIVAAFVVLALAAPAAVTRLRQTPPGRLALQSSIAVAVLLVTAGAARAFGASAPPLGAATMDFDQQGYLHSTAVRFGNGAVLLGYNYSASSLAPGEHLGLAFEWQASPGATYQLDLVSPAEHLLGVQATFASVAGAVANQHSAVLPIPADLPPGLYLPRLKLLQGSLLAPALTFHNQPRGDLYLRPVHILPGPSRPPQASSDQQPAITLVSLTAMQPAPTRLRLALGWQTAAPLPANYLLAVRLHDPFGFELAALDLPPTGGIYPTSAWRAGEVITDHLALDLPAGLPPGDYPLSLTFYHAADLSAAQSFTQPVSLSRWTPPPGTEPLHAFDDALALHSLDLPAEVRAGERFHFAALWAARAPLPQDLSARWSLVNPNGQIAVVEPHPLAGQPTTDWAAGVLVLGRPSLRLSISAPAGEYDLQVQLLDSAGNLLTPSVVVGKLRVAASDRTTVLPALQHRADVDLGPLTLAGYDIAIEQGSLNLTFYSQAEAAMPANYKYFVHLFNPADEFIAAQSDGFPDIPTSEWEAEEVVGVTVSLPIDSLEPGFVYNVAVGWYDPENGDRLGERVILNQGITRP